MSETLKSSKTTPKSGSCKSSILENCDNVVTKFCSERRNVRTQKGPNSLPKANFNPLVECDFMAYEKVNPNFSFGGHWFSKNRYGTCMYKGEIRACEIDPTENRRVVRVVDNPQSEPDHTADECDWDKLQPDYEYWRLTFFKQGFYHTRFEAFLGERGS